MLRTEGARVLVAPSKAGSGRVSAEEAATARRRGGGARPAEEAARCRRLGPEPAEAPTSRTCFRTKGSVTALWSTREMKQAKISHRPNTARFQKPEDFDEITHCYKFPF